MTRSITAVFLVVILLFSFQSNAFAAIGDEDAKKHVIEGDIEAEKLQEGLFFTPVALGVLSATPAAPFAALTVGTGTYGLGKIADPKYAIWENWPMNRWTFSHASPDTWGLSYLTNKGLAGAGDWLANLLFGITKSLTRISINLVVLAFNTDLIGGMIGWVSEGMKDIFASDKDITWLMLSWGLIFLLVYTVFRFLHGQVASTVTALLIAVVAVGGTFFFINNSQSLLTNIAKGTDSATGIFLGGVGNYVHQDADLSSVSNPIDKGLIACGQASWQAIVAAPWAAAMFGTVDEKDLKLTSSEATEISKSIDKNIPAGMRIDTLYLATIGEKRNDVVEVLASTDKKIDHGNHGATIVGMGANSTGEHFQIAFLTLFPAIAFLVLSVMLAVPILFAQFMMCVLLLILPGALLCLITPVYGWAVASKYFKAVAQFFLVKLFYGLYLSLVLAIGTGFTLALLKSHQVGLGMLVLTAIFAASAFFRKKAFNAVAEGFGMAKSKYSSKFKATKNAKLTMDMLRKVRNISIADMLIDTMDFRRGRKKDKSDDKDDKPPPPRNDDNNPPPPPPPPPPGNTGSSRRRHQYKNGVYGRRNTKSGVNIQKENNILPIDPAEAVPVKGWEGNSGGRHGGYSEYDDYSGYGSHNNYHEQPRSIHTQPIELTGQHSPPAKQSSALTKQQLASTRPIEETNQQRPIVEQKRTRTYREQSTNTNTQPIEPTGQHTPPAKQRPLETKQRPLASARTVGETNQQKPIQGSRQASIYSERPTNLPTTLDMNSKRENLPQ